jgi:hypothetical protein
VEAETDLSTQELSKSSAQMNTVWTTMATEWDARAADSRNTDAYGLSDWARGRPHATLRQARKAADERGWTLEKDGKVFRLVADNGTIVAGDWAKPDDGYFGLSLADIAKALGQ